MENINRELNNFKNLYAEKHPEWRKLYEWYKSAFAKHMQTVYGQFPSQPLRDTAVQLLMEMEENYPKWVAIDEEKDVLEMQIKINMQLSRNFTSQQYNG